MQLQYYYFLVIILSFLFPEEEEPGIEELKLNTSAFKNIFNCCNPWDFSAPNIEWGCHHKFANANLLAKNICPWIINTSYNLSVLCFWMDKISVQITICGIINASQ